MKTIYVKDKSGFNNGGMREIYEHQYDSRKHTLIGEASTFDISNIPDKNKLPPKAPLPVERETITNTQPAPSVAAPAPAPAAPAARPAAPAPKPVQRAAPRPAAPKPAAPAAPAQSSARNDDESAGSYWNKEAERNRAQGGKPLPNEFNIFGKKDEAPAAPAPKAAAPKPAAPKPAAPSVPLPPPRPKDLSTLTPQEKSNADDLAKRSQGGKIGDDGNFAFPAEKTPPAGKIGPVDKAPVAPSTNSPGNFQSLESDSIKGDSNSRLMQKRGDKELFQKLNPPSQKSPFDSLSTGLGNFRDALFRKGDNESFKKENLPLDIKNPPSSVMRNASSETPSSETPSPIEKRGTFNSGLRKAMQVEETDPGFSEAELAHFASIMEAEPVSPTDPAYNRTARKVGNSDQVGSSLNTNVVSSRDLTDEFELEEGRGRPPKPGSKAWHAKNGTSPETSDDTASQGRDPRQHIQVIAGQAAAGRQIDFKHNDDSTSKITPAMGRKITSHLNGLKPADRQAAVNKMHDSAEGLKI